MIVAPFPDSEPGFCTISTGRPGLYLFYCRLALREIDTSNDCAGSRQFASAGRRVGAKWEQSPFQRDCLGAKMGAENTKGLAT